MVKKDLMSCYGNTRSRTVPIRWVYWVKGTVQPMISVVIWHTFPSRLMAELSFGENGGLSLIVRSTSYLAKVCHSGLPVSVAALANHNVTIIRRAKSPKRGHHIAAQALSTSTGWEADQNRQTATVHFIDDRKYQLQSNQTNSTHSNTGITPRPSKLSESRGLPAFWNEIEILKRLKRTLVLTGQCKT